MSSIPRLITTSTGNVRFATAGRQLVHDAGTGPQAVAYLFDGFLLVWALFHRR